MSKVNYPDRDSIAGLTRNSINDAYYRLGNAQGFCSFVLPQGCPNAEYIKGLYNRIGNLRYKTANLLKSIESIDKNYALTKEGINNITAKLSVDVIDDRHRHIY